LFFATEIQFRYGTTSIYAIQCFFSYLDEVNVNVKINVEKILDEDIRSKS